MADDLRMDSHKLIFHPDRVARWLNGEDIYPLGVEIALSGGCNHRCIFCALDYMEYKPIILESDLIISNIKIMAERGLKSIVFAGEGEPLINKNAANIINTAKSNGVDVAMSTNGVLLTPSVSKECLASLTWIRISLSAGKSTTYNSIHRGNKGDFEKVIANVSEAVRVKREKGLDTTIGVQMLLIPENCDEILILAKLLKEIGVDYFTVKPFSKHPKSISNIAADFDYNEYLGIEDQLNQLSTENFKVYFRAATMRRKQVVKKYDKCYGLPFFTYIDANAQVWPCIAFLGDKELSYGSLKEMNFVELWEGKKRSSVLEKFKSMDISGCRELCRLDEINNYLYDLKNPSKHVNFI